MKYDVIIVGGGLGGLTAGAKLAKSGKRVLLLEQHDRPGGCATTFTRKGYTMEVGLHEMDGLHQGDLKNKIFRDLGIFDRVEFLEVPEFYRFKNSRYDITVPHNPERAMEILLKNFPDQGEGLNSYFEHVLSARKIIAAATPGSDTSVGEWLDKIIGNEDLKLVLLGNLGYFHDDPYTLSYYYYLTAQGSYYGGRANFIKGGSQQLSNALSSVITENGGEVRLKSLVTSIIYNEIGPAGVEYIPGSGKDKTAVKEYCDQLVINSSLPCLAGELLRAEEGGRLMTEISKNEPGASLLTVYYGFKRPLKEVGNRHYSTFVYHDTVKTQKDILANNHSDFDTRSFTFVDYSQVDSGLAPVGKSVGAVCCTDYTADWINLSEKEYSAKKEQVARIMTERLDKIIPGFAGAVEIAEVGTSLTVKRYTLNPGGEVYGFARKPGLSTAYLDALPSNVHIASAWGKFGGGFSGAIYSGYMTAMEILRKR